MSGTSISFDLIARDKASATFDRVSASAEKTNHRLSGLARAGGLAVRGLGLVTAGLGVAGAVGIKTAANLQQAQIGFETMLGSGRKARAFLGQLQKFAATTPFEMPGLIENSRMLLGVGVQAKNVIPLLQDFGDAAGALGIPQEAFNRAMLAMSQSISAGKIKLGDMNQLMNAGLPIWQLLSQAMHKPVPAIQAMISKGQLMTKDVLPKLQAAMHKDYGGAMAQQSQTLAGLWSTLMDTMNIGLANALMPLVPMFQKVMPAAISVLGKALAGIPAMIGRVKDFAGPLAANIKDALGGIDIKGIGKGLAEQAKSWATPVIGGFNEGLNTGNWSGLGKALGNGIVRAVGAIGSMVGRLGKILGDLFAKVDWVGIGISMGKQAPSLLIGLAAGIANFDLGGLLRGMAQHWQDILLGILAIAVAPAKWVGKIAQLLGRIPFAGHLLEWGLMALKRFADGLIGKIGSALGFVGRAFLTGFRRVFPTVGKAFYEGLLLLPTRLGVIALDVQGKAGKMMVGLARAIGRGIFTVAAKIGELVARILKPFASAGGWLIDAGRAVVGGLGRGIGKALGMVGSALAAVGRAVVRATAGFGKLLYSAGKDIMRGLINGIGSMAGAVGHKVTSIAHGAVSAVKGALGIHSPSRVFSEIGVNMIEGLVRGIDKRKVKLDTVLSKLTDYITRQGDKIASLLDAKKGVVSSVQGFASSVFGADFSEQGGASIGNIIAFQKQQRDQARQLQADIRRLTQMGLSKNLVQQLVDSGSGGEANIHALAGASAAQIAQLNALNNQTNAALTSAGSAAGGALYNDQIAQAKRDQALAVAIRRELEAMRKDQDKNTVIQLHLEGRTLQASLLQLKRKNGNRALGLA